jgi:DNA repair protein RadA/Sms
MSAVRADAVTAMSTQVGELDRVLGGGIVGGAVVLLAGEPGVGKSTLLLEVAAATARRGARSLYITGEESSSQVRMRAERTGAVEDALFLAAESDIGAVLTHVDAVQPELLVIDSVQTLSCSEVDGAAGGVTQVRAVTAALVQVAKSRSLPVVLVGHVTKDGSVAGPRALEHIVDVVLQFDGDPSSRLRLLRSTKNRFGPVDEIGCFELAETGIVEVPDPSGLFVSRHCEPLAGTCVTVTLEGRRPLLAEVQALVTPTPTPHPRRAVSGLDSARVAMLLAVLERRVGLRMNTADVYAATLGGASVRSPSADLAIAVALASAATDRVVPPGTVCFGEIGLAGELRRVTDIEHRLSEAARLGFSAAVIPADVRAPLGAVQAVRGIAVVQCIDLRAALGALRLLGDGSAAEPIAGLQVVG